MLFYNLGKIMFHLNIINYILKYLIIKIINHYFLINVTINI